MTGSLGSGELPFGGFDAPTLAWSIQSTVGRRHATAPVRGWISTILHDQVRPRPGAAASSAMSKERRGGRDMMPEVGRHSATDAGPPPGIYTGRPKAESQRTGDDAKPRVLSQNGTWWWNGRRWVSAVSEDGLWRWIGNQWKPTVELDGKRPEQLAKTFTGLADDCYARAGVILTDRAQAWQP